MAGDWIPIETDLTTQQKVLVMSGLIGVSPFEIVGRLCHFWSWFTSQQVVELSDKSGAIVGAYRDGVIDVGATSTEMFDALVYVGWLRTGDVDGKKSLIVPRFGSWLAKCSKARKQKAQRQRRWREGRREAPTEAPTEALTETRKKTSFVARNVDASKRGKVKGKSKEETPYIPPRGTSTSASTYVDAFLTWWEAYPKKVGKRVAFTAWQRATKRIRQETACTPAESHTRLLAAAASFAVSPKGLGEYCPHPATWLNQGRYDDDPATWQDGGRSGVQPAENIDIGGMIDD